MLARPGFVVAAWMLITVLAGAVASGLSDVLRGGTDPIAGSSSEHVTREVERVFGEGTLYQYLLVLSSHEIGVDDPRFVDVATRLAASIGRLPVVRAVETPWNAPRPELLGRNGHTALLVVTPSVNAYLEAERFAAALRGATAAAQVPREFTLEVTGTTAAIHAMDVQSSSDLIAAEKIGLPIALVVLLIVFGAPVAALLPLVLAMVAVSIGFAGLYALHWWTPVTVFAENVVSMIGLGVGVDYALFIVSHYREEIAGGRVPRAAAATAIRTAGRSVMISGITVAVGFLSLFLVRAPFLHTIALGGVFVVAAAVAASLTLLPAMLVLLDRALSWPRRRTAAPAAREHGSRFWIAWVGAVMRRPWLVLGLSSLVLLVLILPVTRLSAWNIGAEHLPATDEARRGYERISREFAPGWMSPIVVLIEAPPGRTLWEPRSRDAILTLAGRLERDPRSGTVLGLHQILGVLNAPQLTAVAGGSAPSVTASPLAALPAPMRAVASRIMGKDGRVGILALMTPAPPEDPATLAYVRELRVQLWPELEAAGLSVQWGGFAAVLEDFDNELFGRLPWAVAAVVLITFVVLAVVFRSLVIPLKATLLNTLSVLAAYGFLILVFQDGIGASWIGLDPPGGLNSFVVLMLFTILFGLSMDYEVFLLSRVREEYIVSGDNARAVALGLSSTAGIITSAALIMIFIFASFGFTKLVPTREFGLGLAFAVALDATLIRVVLVPALMAVSGRWNWWLPGRRAKP
jgi:RND superfamily putative drug exporter